MMSTSELVDDLFPAAGSTEQALTDEQGSAAGPSSPKVPAILPVNNDSDGGSEVGDDLFGDEDEDEKPDAPEDAESTATPVTSAASEHASRTGDASPNPMEYPEEDVSEEEQFENVRTIAIPKAPRLQSTDGKVWLLRLPAYVNMEPAPYDPEYYRATLQDDPVDGKAEPIKAKQRMLGIRSTIRWRWETGPDGTPIRKSNARMLRWSDGTMSLQLGKDIYDVATSHGTTLARPQDPQPSTSQSAPPLTTFVCRTLTNEKILMTESAIAGQLSLVPTSANSATHMELANQVRQQHIKRSRMRVLDDVVKPEEMQKMLLKAEGKDVVQKPRVKRESGPSSRSGRTSRRSRSTRRARSEDSDSDRGYNREREYDEDDGFVVADDDEEVEAETEDEDDAAYGSTKKTKSKKAKKGKKRKGSESMDELELADRRLDARERERKKAKMDKKKSREYVDSEDDDSEVDDADEMDAVGQGDAEDDMDVESEDE